MRKIKQKFTIFMVLFSVIFNLESIIYAANSTDGWYKSQYTGAWYYCKNGEIVKNGWATCSDGKWYYLGETGAMVTNTTTPDGYYVDSDGAWDGKASIYNTGSTENSDEYENSNNNSGGSTYNCSACDEEFEQDKIFEHLIDNHNGIIE